MAIDWDLRDMSPLTPRNGITDTLIYLTPVIGIGEITQKNAAEVYARIMLLQTLEGPMMQTITEDDEIVPTAITLQHVEDHIGLKARNVPTETWRSFSARIMRNWHQKMVSRSNNAREAILR